ncbi:MAG TPA: hypothetical protein VN706_11945 [Gemmatimonadaceae bacterium]|nr:hypothetical protein [Gemmatimonadaceae bacterium]
MAIVRDRERADYFRKRIEHLFYASTVGDAPHSIRFISEYCRYLASGIDQRGAIVIPPDLLGSFESVYLWLSDRIKGYPDGVKNQVKQIVDGEKLCDRFARLASLSEHELEHYRRRRTGASVKVDLVGMLLRPSFGYEDGTLSRSELFDIRTALGRLAQVLTFTASIEPVDYDEALVDSTDHFDPNLIDRNRLAALIAILRIQAAEIPDAANKQRIGETVDRLETELKRPKVRWGIVISTAFVLFGFLADLKTISPETYEAVHRTAETIVSVLHHEGQVQKATNAKLGKEAPPRHKSPAAPDQYLLLTDGVVRQNDDE